MTVVRMNLDKLGKFLKKTGSSSFKYQLHRVAKNALRRIWLTKVMTKDYSQVYKIPTKAEMVNMIRTGAEPPQATYSEEYRERKRKGLYFPYTAGLPPHVLTGNLAHAILFTATPERITMQLQTRMLKSQPPQAPRKHVRVEGAYKIYTTLRQPNVTSTFNYFLKHEQEKSILKSTFVLGWQNMMESMSNFIIHTAQNI